jgi:hypothetical protein
MAASRTMTVDAAGFLPDGPGALAHKVTVAGVYSEATARQIKAVRRALVNSGYIEKGKIDEPNRDLWWSWQKVADANPESGDEELEAV